jgi:DNA processing protein
VDKFGGPLRRSVELTGIRSVTPAELLGPLTSLELKHAPPRLYVAGRLRLPLAHPRVAIVGTRNPSTQGLETASRIAGELGLKGVIIVSGLARGVDTAAHTAALEADGTTICVLGTPLSRTYPIENTELQHRIMRDNLAVSQFAESDPVLPRNFVIRNRTMALLADASIIIESGEGGGSLNQGWETLRLGRPLFIHEREFEKPGVEWPHKMALYGAVRFREASDIFDQIPSPIPNPEFAVTLLEAA